LKTTHPTRYRKRESGVEVASKVDRSGAYAAMREAGEREDDYCLRYKKKKKGKSKEIIKSLT